MIQHVRNFSILFRADRNAVTAIEYSLIAALVAVVIIGALSLVGGGITGTLNAVAAQV